MLFRLNLPIKGIPVGCSLRRALDDGESSFSATWNVSNLILLDTNQKKRSTRASSASAPACPEMQALVKGLHSGGSLAKLLPALGAAASARITTTAAAPAATADSAAVTTPLEREFLVYRWHPEEGGKPKYQSYKLDLNECGLEDAS